VSLTPCSTCPWRKDAVKRVRQPANFRALFTNCQDDGLSIMLCHHSKEERADLFCRGWVLVVGVAAIGVRLLMCRGKVKPADLDRPKRCPELFGSFAAMLRANGVRPPRRNRVRG
jgi:Family of unknown function (DUF6283)